MNASEFKTTYTDQYFALIGELRELDYEGGIDILGSRSEEDVAEWLARRARVKYDVALLFVKIFC